MAGKNSGINLKNNENQASFKERDNRWYTYTIKACDNGYKGNSVLLQQRFKESLAHMCALDYEYVVEHRGTKNEHIHALVLCKEYIPNKMVVSKHPHFRGFSIKFDIIRKEFEQDKKDIYKLYMHKELSDSEKLYNVYGNMFI